VISFKRHISASSSRWASISPRRLVISSAWPGLVQAGDEPRFVQRGQYLVAYFGLGEVGEHGDGAAPSVAGGLGADVAAAAVVPSAA
jgi:hypothetical protein